MVINTVNKLETQHGRSSSVNLLAFTSLECALSVINFTRSTHPPSGPSLNSFLASRLRASGDIAGMAGQRPQGPGVSPIHPAAPWPAGPKLQPHLPAVRRFPNYCLLYFPTGRFSFISLICYTFSSPM